MLSMALALGATNVDLSRSAVAVVRALENNDWGAALTALGGHTGPELAEVARQAIVLGADDSTVQALVGTLTGEIIEVAGEAPPMPIVSKPLPWLWILLATGAIGFGIYRYRKLGKIF